MRFIKDNRVRQAKRAPDATTTVKRSVSTMTGVTESMSYAYQLHWAQDH